MRFTPNLTLKNCKINYWYCTSVILLQYNTRELVIFDVANHLQYFHFKHVKPNGEKRICNTLNWLNAAWNAIMIKIKTYRKVYSLCIIFTGCNTSTQSKGECRKLLFLSYVLKTNVDCWIYHWIPKSTVIGIPLCSLLYTHTTDHFTTFYKHVSRLSFISREL